MDEQILGVCSECQSVHPVSPTPKPPECEDILELEEAADCVMAPHFAGGEIHTGTGDNSQSLVKQ